MTSPCEVHIYSRNQTKAKTVAKKILMMSKMLEKKYNFYNPTSYLSSLNKRQENKLDYQTKELLNRAKIFYKKTNTIFDITMGTLVNSRKLNSLEAIKEEQERLKSFIGAKHFTIKKDKLYFDNPYTLIDLGGFVKEFAVDKAIAILKKEKIESALVNFGGDIYALGLKPNGNPFRIGIKNPKNPQEYITHLEITNQALTTSASYERNHNVEGEELSHIISHETTLQKEIISSTVISSTVVESGVYSTSLMIEPTLPCKLQRLLIDKELNLLITNQP